MMKSSQYLLKYSTNLAYDAKTMNSQIYSFKFGSNWVHNEKGMDFFLYLLYPAHFRSDGEIIDVFTLI